MQGRGFCIVCELHSHSVHIRFQSHVSRLPHESPHKLQNGVDEPFWAAHVSECLSKGIQLLLTAAPETTLPTMGPSPAFSAFSGSVLLQSAHVDFHALPFMTSSCQPT